MKVCASLSIMGNTLIIVSYFRFQALRKQSFRLILYLSIADLGAAAPFFLALGEPDGIICQIQAFLFTFFQLASVLWTVVIGQILYETIVLRLNIEDNVVQYYSFALWGVSLIAAVVPLVTGSYGDAQGWCWIEETKELHSVGDVGLWLRVGCFYGPLMLCIMYNFVIYIKIRKKIASLIDSTTSDADQFELKVTLQNMHDRLKWYPVILVACYTFPCINRIYQYVQEGMSPFWIVLLAGLFCHCPVARINVI